MQGTDQVYYLLDLGGGMQNAGEEEGLRSCGCRWRKSAAEVELMRQSASLAAQSLARCMQLTKPGVEEHFLGATFGARSFASSQALPQTVNLLCYCACDLRRECLRYRSYMALK